MSKQETPEVTYTERDAERRDAERKERWERLNTKLEKIRNGELAVKDLDGWEWWQLVEAG